MKYLKINSRQAEILIRCLDKHLPEDDNQITEDEFEVIAEIASIVEK